MDAAPNPLPRKQPNPRDHRPIVANRNRYEVTLGDTEMRLVEAVVNVRMAHDREWGNPGWDFGEKTWHKMLNFTGAELAFGKLFNVYVDFDRRYRWYDVKLSDGRTVDVKFTNQDQGHLIVSLDVAKRRIPDLFALMAGGFPTFEFRGIVPGEVFLRPENVKDFGHGPCYALPQSRLSLDLDW